MDILSDPFIQKEKAAGGTVRLYCAPTRKSHLIAPGTECWISSDHFVESFKFALQERELSRRRGVTLRIRMELMEVDQRPSQAVAVFPVIHCRKGLR